MSERAFDVPAGYARAALSAAPRTRELWAVRVPEGVRSMADKLDLAALDGVTIALGSDQHGAVSAGGATYDLRDAAPAAPPAHDSSQLLDMASTRANQFFDPLDMHGAAAELASAAVLVPTESGTLRLDKKRPMRRLYLALRPPAPEPARMPHGGGALGKKTGGPRAQPTERLQGVFRPPGSADTRKERKRKSEKGERDTRKKRKSK